MLGHFPQQERVQRRFHRGSFQLSGTQFNILDKIPLSKTSLTPVHAAPWVGEHFALSVEGTEAGTALCRFQEAAFSELHEGGAADLIIPGSESSSSLTDEIREPQGSQVVCLRE